MIYFLFVKTSLKFDSHSFKIKSYSSYFLSITIFTIRSELKKFKQKDRQRVSLSSSYGKKNFVSHNFLKNLVGKKLSKMKYRWQQRKKEKGGEMCWAFVLLFQQVNTIEEEQQK